VHIKSHSRDYESALNAKQVYYDEPYCVYLDCDVVDSSDYLIQNAQHRPNIASYEKKVVTFLNWLRETYNVNIIIAAHPKSRFYKGLNSYNGFKVVHNQTASLVKGCRFVVNEGSTAISYAVLFNKPLVFFTMKEVSFFYKICCAFAKALGKEVISVDNILSTMKHDVSKEFAKTENYQRYKYNYLTYASNTSTCVFDLIEEIANCIRKVNR
jgi:hypothetical protein